MGYLQKPFVTRVNDRGYVKGVEIVDSTTGKPNCRRFGGIPYAQPITSKQQRWRRPQVLPEALRYGAQSCPTDYTGLSAECPQGYGGAYADKSRMSEDCLQCNIWVPIGKAPEKGWPVWIYIHGGYLQWGSPNRINPSSLLSETSIRCIIVAPTYRLNLLGFLASQELLDEASPNGETVGNLGFWDQRLALEWTYANIADFGGDKRNITVGGLSAGAYSTFHQLAHELGRPDNEAIIRRVVLHSNGCGLPPKDLREVQSHFDTLLEALEAPYGLQAKGKIAFLRSLSTEKLIDAVSLLPENSFRAVNDGQWVRHSLFREIEDGTFARVMLKRGIKIMIGDVPDERNEYKRVQPPNSYGNLVRRLSVEYPVSAAEKLARLYCPGRNIPTRSNWTETFGRIYADMQVHVTERGLLAALAKALPLSFIYRYQINWRAKCVEKYMPLEMGVSHGSDIPIWFFGNGTELEENEKPVMRKWLEPFGKFLEGGELEWGTGRIEDVRALKADMSIGVIRDEDWFRCLEVWRDLQRVRLSRL